MNSIYISKCSRSYHYGFNGKEKDDEVSGKGNQYDYGFRIYNPRLGRFLSTDPLFKSFPWYTPYQFSGNKPIKCVDLDGLEEVDYRVLEKRENGSVLVKVNRTENTTAQSNRGILLIHNISDGQDYNEFEYAELNNMFGIDENSQNVASKVTEGFPTKSDYKYLLSDESDLIKSTRYNTDDKGNKLTVSFTALVSKERTITPYSNIGGSVTTVLNTPSEIADFLKRSVSDMINSNQSAMGLEAGNVELIKLTIPQDVYEKMDVSSFRNNLQGMYPNADIGITSKEKSGWSAEYQGKEIEAKPKPVD